MPKKRTEKKFEKKLEKKKLMGDLPAKSDSGKLAKLGALKDKLPKAVKNVDLTTVGTVAAFAVTGYTLWKNREKIKTFFADSDLPAKLGAFGETVAEKASSVSEMIARNVGVADKTGKKIAGQTKKTGVSASYN